VEAEEALAQGYGRSQRWLKAERSYTRLIELQPDRQVFRLARGNARLELGRYDQAAADFQELLEKAPKHFEVRIFLAHCFLKNARMAEAEKEFLLCHELQPAHPGPLVGLANCALEKGELDNAQKLIQEALSIVPDSAMALRIQCSLYLRRQRYDLAIPLYEALLKINSRDKEAHLKLAQALKQTGDQKRAQEHQEVFQRIDREDAERERRMRIGRPTSHASS
jgi:tetratricopeptide (TPR) repeat protein